MDYKTLRLYGTILILNYNPRLNVFNAIFQDDGKFKEPKTGIVRTAGQISWEGELSNVHHLSEDIHEGKLKSNLVLLDGAIDEHHASTKLTVTRYKTPGIFNITTEDRLEITHEWMGVLHKLTDSELYANVRHQQDRFVCFHFQEILRAENKQLTHSDIKRVLELIEERYKVTFVLSGVEYCIEKFTDGRYSLQIDKEENPTYYQTRVDLYTQFIKTFNPELLA